MPNQTVKVISDEHNGFFAYADKDTLAKWREDRTVPLVDVVETFQIYQSDNKSISGVEHIASRSDLKNTFGYDDVTSCIEQILANGKDQALSRDSRKQKNTGGYTGGRRGSNNSGAR